MRNAEHNEARDGGVVFEIPLAPTTNGKPAVSFPKKSAPLALCFDSGAHQLYGSPSTAWRS